MTSISKAASALGKKGGSVKSPQKARAARQNGRKGGRKPDPFRAGLKAAGVRWRHVPAGIRFYVPGGKRGGLEIGSWELARECEYLTIFLTPGKW